MAIDPEMTLTDEPDASSWRVGQLSLSTTAPRNLATTTKTPPQMAGITSRWLVRQLPWVEVSGSTYRVNRRLTVRTGRERVSFIQPGADQVRVVPETLTEIPVLRGFDDPALCKTGLPDEYGPGVRFMGVDDRAVLQYLVTAYDAVAILVPDAIGIMEHVDTAAARS
ncbi:hypothetical protein [Nocardia sp. NBC_01009]|uniref:hypothetical protein n=1 Tax=Nocardia sp. NBC_01009 TaxID=2975996 RepID=UPI00386D2929|nr:hypothetical protein OHA42_24865 [Nocardia sp. NBC_01009]